MSTFACPASTRLENNLDVPLTPQERFRIAVQLGSAMVAGGLLLVGFAQQKWGSPESVNVAELIKALAACIVAVPIFISAIRGLIRQDPNTFSDQLVSLATLAAMVTGEFTTATLIPMIMHVGHFLEERSILGAQAAIEGLRTLHARTAYLLTDSGEVEVDPAQLSPGDVFVVRPGDTIPADGEIIEGISAVDQSSITGESAPEDLAPGDPVYAATINLSGLLKVKVTRAGEDTTLGKVVDLLREAEQSKTPVLKLIERYAAYYVPIILIIAAVVLFVTRDMSRAVTVLVVGCPGALILAGPTAMVAALAAASRLGILIKNTRFLESLADVDTVILDKTGTVTIGRLELAEIRPQGEESQDELLSQAAVCATASRHPVSRAVVLSCEQRGVEAEEIEATVMERSGKGMQADFRTGRLLLGRREWLTEEGFDPPEEPEHLGSIVWLARERFGESAPAKRVLGCFLLADSPRPEAKEALQELRRIGIRRSVLLTGDRKAVARRIGAALEMDEVIAEVLPEQKLETVHREKAADRSVMMVGDGVNDALALASGDVGVALGAVASDIALQSADIALMSNDLRRLPQAVELARGTRAAIHENVLIGAGASIALVALASSGVINPLIGVILHNVGELFVIINSARILRFSRESR